MASRRIKQGVDRTATPIRSLNSTQVRALEPLEAALYCQNNDTAENNALSSMETES